MALVQGKSNSSLVKSEMHRSVSSLETEFDSFPEKTNDDTHSIQSESSTNSIQHDNETYIRSNDNIALISAEAKPVCNQNKKSMEPIQCHICGKSLSSQGALYKHLVVIHNKLRLYMCEHCGKSFGQHGDLKRHYLTHTGEKPFQCEVCKKFMSKASSLKLHMRTHTGERPYECQVCGKTFAIVSDMKRHVRIHSGEKLYLCQLCSRSFGRKEHLAAHYLTHSKDISLSPMGVFDATPQGIQCVFCLQNFKDRNTLRKHYMTHINKNSSDKEHKTSPDIETKLNKKRSLSDDVTASDKQGVKQASFDGKTLSSFNDLLTGYVNMASSTSRVDGLLSITNIPGYGPFPIQLWGSSYIESHNVNTKTNDKESTLGATLNAENREKQILNSLDLKFHKGGRQSSSIESNSQLLTTTVVTPDLNEHCDVSPDIERVASSPTQTLPRLPTEMRMRNVNSCISDLENSSSSDLDDLPELELICKDEKFDSAVKPHFENDTELINAKNNSDYTENSTTTVDDPINIKSDSANRVINYDSKMEITGNSLKLKLRKRKNSKKRQPFDGQCEQCGLRFTSRAQFGIHARTHSGHKPHHCHICEKAYASKGDLKLHIQSHSGERKFMCEVCGNSYLWAKSLKVHKLTHASKRPHKCDTCNKAFFLKADLARHCRGHLGIKPHVCSQCNRSFARKEHLIQHSYTHLHVKPNQCKKCHKTFAQKVSLQKHKTKCNFKSVVKFENDVNVSVDSTAFSTVRSGIINGCANSPVQNGPLNTDWQYCKEEAAFPLINI